MPAMRLAERVLLSIRRAASKATARGCVFVVREACKKLGINPAKATAAVQGYGNAGSIAARLLQDLGVKIVAVSDSKGGAYNPAGIDPFHAEEIKAKHGSVTDLKEAEAMRARLIGDGYNPIVIK